MAPKPKTSTQLNTWDSRLAEQAAIAAGTETASLGSFFGLEGGVLTFDGAELPGNEMAVIIVDSLHENVFYKEKYNRDAPASPTCFAFSHNPTDERLPLFETLVPHADSPIPQCEQCQGCPNNEWGSAETGAGKACRNVRRVAMISAGHFDKAGNFEPILDTEHYESAQVAYMKLPVTSVKGYGAWVKQLASTLQRPPHGVFAHVKVVRDSDTQFKVLFEALAKVPDALMDIIMKKHDDTVEQIAFPYVQRAEEEAPAPKRGGKKSAPAPVGKPAPAKAKGRPAPPAPVTKGRSRF